MRVRKSYFILRGSKAGRTNAVINTDFCAAVAMQLSAVTACFLQLVLELFHICSRISNLSLKRWSISKDPVLN